MSRYFVDIRSGCVAVRDRNHTDPDYQGLHADTEGVVWYRHGERVVETCEKCGHTSSSGWKISPKDVAEAERVCESLNRTKTTS